MKNILNNYKVLALALVVSLSSCDSILEPQPRLDISSEFAITDKRGAEAALLGAYSELQSNNYYGLEYPAQAYLSADEADWSGSFNFYQQFDLNAIPAENSTIKSVWSQIYRVINVSNNLIDKVPAIQDRNLTDVQRQKILGEAYFLRALAYFDLGRAWGGVPLVLQPTVDKNSGKGIKRASREQTYAQVLADLEQAELLLPALTVRSRASKEAVWALKARLYLYQQNWEKAEAFASLVLNSGKSRLVQPYSAFYTGKLTEESILELVYDNADRNSHANYWLTSSRGGRYEWKPSAGITQDLRNPAVGGSRSALIGSQVNNGSETVYGQKYTKVATGEDGAFILRIAEQYLIRAEARLKRNNLAGGLADLNEVRKRAELQPFVTADLNAALLAVEQERKVELAFEGHRWFDLIRTGRAAAVLGIADANKFLFPIPNSEILADPDLGPEDQNPGY
ncbi:RagB/SusD family nutrient uptake outer membrane protein [Pontibacter sp. BT731]|uniref:RagB/SusD family nutrient uptake outer membrane protein n=1 Tax=Pontibacter coccineus TaxID=3063328 RepID=UPI0026E28347|nr:RagB/SusD family nutrient uptake outer membrane protein [Pontibacter sp. BT731]MDO6388830.1 RagB/SusD family nutrient uptake outer membrane protein [Pontibacter sp. BT731]